MDNLHEPMFTHAICYFNVPTCSFVRLLHISVSLYERVVGIDGFASSNWRAGNLIANLHIHCPRSIAGFKKTAPATVELREFGEGYVQWDVTFWNGILALLDHCVFNQVALDNFVMPC